MQQKDLVGDQTLTIPVLGQSTAGNADEWSGVKVPFRCRIVAARWIPAAAVTADGSNYFTLNLRNRGSDGSGSNLPASRSYAATNSTAFVSEDMTLGASGIRNLAEGDVLTVSKVNTGTGLACPDGVVQVTVQAR
ncbi:hypothetical protein [Lentzea sp. NBRC 102530]|uniref:hypothetical protein n=1 Tax=Lentzea sp. NBRC 102530 TaxID=3032201 RepID=UPI0024A55FA1|nr:hypothetical protein [Lentzea sp. NBRC 102530]GLY55215.1 hypothetical protein Lesp01_88700 [Lentzea sp. NBRC 102530]